MTSPTFTLVHSYHGGRIPLHHADVYRLDRMAEVADLALAELLEETGYAAEEMEEILVSPTAAGMTPELCHLFLARGLSKVAAGGGVAGENIHCHIVPLEELRSFLAERQARGDAVDFKIYAGLAAANVAF